MDGVFEDCLTLGIDSRNTLDVFVGVFVMHLNFVITFEDLDCCFLIGEFSKFSFTSASGDKAITLSASLMNGDSGSCGESTAFFLNGEAGCSDFSIF